MILLDTHVLVWAVGDSKRLSRAATSAIRRNRRQGGLAVSAITVWELAWLLAHGRIQAQGTIETAIELLLGDVAILPITPAVAALAIQFPDDYPHDRTDRIIGATARADGLTLITRDEKIRRSPLLNTLW